MGLCPFHGEKTASFSVAPDKGIYYCFGCHKGGGVINFQMEIEGLSYPDAVRALARRAGMEVPEDEQYHGVYAGEQKERDLAYHQGTVWVWPLEHYVKAKFDVQGKGFLYKAEEILENFEEEMSIKGIGSISEIYEGDPPHDARGAISQAWSVGALLRINEMIEKQKK